MSNESPRYDLIERTTAFGVASVKFCKTLPRDTVLTPLISQLIRSSTSIGANYHEADDAESKNDFRHKIGICKKEARETTYWLSMVAEAYPASAETCKKLSAEAKELNLIFNAIIRKLDQKL